MKELGIARHLDQLGRITLPIELRRTIGIKEGDPLEVYVDGKVICLKVVEAEENKCAICGRSGELFELYDVLDKRICKKCAIAVVDKVMEE